MSECVKGNLNCRLIEVPKYDVELININDLRFELNYLVEKYNVRIQPNNIIREKREDMIMYLREKYYNLEFDDRVVDELMECNTIGEMEVVLFKYYPDPKEVRVCQLIGKFVSIYNVFGGVAYVDLRRGYSLEELKVLLHSKMERGVVFYGKTVGLDLLHTSCSLIQLFNLLFGVSVGDPDYSRDELCDVKFWSDWFNEVYGDFLSLRIYKNGKILVKFKDVGVRDLVVGEYVKRLERIYNSF